MAPSSTFRCFLVLLITITSMLHDIEATDGAGDGRVQVLMTKPTRGTNTDKLIGGRKMMVEAKEEEKDEENAAAAHNINGNGTSARRRRRRSGRKSRNPSLHLNKSEMVGFTADYHLPKSHPPKHN